MYEKILVPLDGSKLAECSLPHLESLVEGGFGREVTLLNIVKVDISWIGMDERHPIDLDELRKPIFAASRRYLREVASRLEAAGINVKTEIVEANRPAQAIIDFAEKSAADLVLMATHGDTGVKRLLLGSVASGVLNGSAVPVLLIRPESCKI